MTNRVVDLVLIYQFLKRLTTPFNQTDAFKLGIIDERGKRLKKPQTKEEEAAYGYFDRLVFNIKKIIEQIPGGKSRIASYGAALYLIRESARCDREYTEEEIFDGLYESINQLENTTNKKLKELIEEAPTNATGSNVVGTGDDKVHWKKIDGRRRDVKAFLRRYTNQRVKRESLKRKKDFMKRLGL